MIVSTKGRDALRVMVHFAKRGGEDYIPLKEIAEAMTLTNKAVAEALEGLPAAKMHCSVLAEEAIKNALKDYYERNGIDYDKTQFPDCENCAHCH